jgi:hypothetical protein
MIFSIRGTQHSFFKNSLAKLFGLSSSIGRGRIQGSRVAILAILSRTEVIPRRGSAVSSMFDPIELHQMKALQTRRLGYDRRIPLKPI